MGLWRTSSAALAVATIGAVVSPLTPVAMAQSLQTQNTSITHACTQVNRDTAVNKGLRITTSPETVTTRFPATVAPGEVFTAYVRPGTMATSSQHGGYSVGRLSYDVAFPPNSTKLSAWMNGAGDGFLNPDTLRVDRISAAGAVTGDGPYARIWGGATVEFGTGNNQTTLNDEQAGLRVNAGTSFRFPEVGLRMRAPVTAGGQTIAIGLKGAGASNGNALAANQINNTIQGGEKAGWTGVSFTWASRFYCSSPGSAGNSLSSTFVDSALPRYIARTSTIMTSEGVHLARSSRSTTLSARVATDEELMDNVRAGGAVMRFDIKDLATDTVIASPTATINADGTASVSHQFPDISGAEVRDNYEVTATYTGRANDIESSTSGSTYYSVGYNEINAGVTLRSSNGAISGGNMPVDLTADLALPSGRTFPAGMQIQLYRNGAPQGAPVSISAGGNTKTVTFPRENLAQQEATRTYIYQAVLTPVIINDLDRYAGQSSVSVAAIVTGSNPGSTLPDGGHGSLDLSTFFRDPALAWETIGGSVTGSGTLSLAMGG